MTRATTRSSSSAISPLSFEPYRELSDAELEARIRRVKDQMGDSLLILGHHYQQDEVIGFADLRGDSFKLSQLAATHGACRAIVFCGVHFMAETTDILSREEVKQLFKPDHFQQFRKRFPGSKILVHPECMMPVVDAADLVGSTEFIIKTIADPPAGSIWGVGTELHLVNRLAHEHSDKQIHFLSPVVCMYATVFRIDMPHLPWCLDNLARGTPVNRIKVPLETARWAKIALARSPMSPHRRAPSDSAIRHAPDREFLSPMGICFRNL
jgi:quinolinate synthase